jgi:cell division protein FtsB
VVKWIVIGVVLLGLVVLALAVRPVLGRLRGIEGALRRLRLRQEEAQVLQAQATELQERVAGLQRQAEEAQERLAVIQAKRPG